MASRTFAPNRAVVMAAALAALMIVLPGSDAFAAQSRHKTKAHASSPAKPAPRRAQKTSCAEYGPGFMPVQGSSTCVKIGGSIGVGVGGRVR
jgi:hypothetical protein